MGIAPVLGFVIYEKKGRLVFHSETSASAEIFVKRITGMSHDKDFDEMKSFSTFRIQKLATSTPDLHEKFVDRLLRANLIVTSKKEYVVSGGEAVIGALRAKKLIRNIVIQWKNYLKQLHLEGIIEYDKKESRALDLTYCEAEPRLNAKEFTI